VTHHLQKVVHDVLLQLLVVVVARLAAHGARARERDGELARLEEPRRAARQRRERARELGAGLPARLTIPS